MPSDGDGGDVDRAIRVPTSDPSGSAEPGRGHHLAAREGTEDDDAAWGSDDGDVGGSERSGATLWTGAAVSTSIA